MAKEAEIKMVRLRNIKSGAIVEVPAEKVERLGGEWESAPPRKTAAKKSAAPATD